MIITIKVNRKCQKSSQASESYEDDEVWSESFKLAYFQQLSSLSFYRLLIKCFYKILTFKKNYIKWPETVESALIINNMDDIQFQQMDIAPYGNLTICPYMSAFSKLLSLSLKNTGLSGMSLYAPGLRHIWTETKGPISSMEIPWAQSKLHKNTIWVKVEDQHMGVRISVNLVLDQEILV